MRLKLVLSVLSRDLNGRRGGGDRRMWIEEAILPDGMVTLSTLIPCHNTAAEPGRAPPQTMGLRVYCEVFYAASPQRSGNRRDFQHLELIPARYS